MEVSLIYETRAYMCYDHIRILNGQQLQCLKSQPLSLWISELAQLDKRRG